MTCRGHSGLPLFLRSGPIGTFIPKKKKKMFRTVILNLFSCVDHKFRRKNFEVHLLLINRYSWLRP